MSTSITEKELQFEFDDDWKVCGKWDGTPASRYEIVAGRGPSKVDLVGVYRDGTVYLIEVKDHSQHPRTNEKPLFDVLRDKVHDTVMAVITGHRRGDTSMLCEPLARALVKPAEAVVVLWLEEPTHAVQATRQQRMGVNGAVLMREYARDFKWLNARLRVVNRNNSERLIRGLTASRIPSSGA
jgi:hypothetical protein